MIEVLSALLASLAYILNIGHCKEWSTMREKSPKVMRPMKEKSRKTALILACMPFGIDRFYLGYIGIGLIKLLTGGGFLILWIIDIIKIVKGTMTDSQGRPLI